MVVLGVDPGCSTTGYGVISGDKLITRGLIKLGRGPIAGRLKKIYCAVSELVDTYNIGELAIEGGFLGKNVDVVVKLGQARAAAILACEMQSVSVYEYSPKEVKMSVVGYGAAEKEQVIYMVDKILGLGKMQKGHDAPESRISEHEADALAVALCHIQGARMRKLSKDN